MVDILREYNWTALNLSYSNVSCNLDHDNFTVYLLATLVELHSSLLYVLQVCVHAWATALGPLTIHKVYTELLTSLALIVQHTEPYIYYLLHPFL